MTSDNNLSCINQIGEAAGRVWQTLASEESISISKLAKSVDAPRDIVMQAIGWLARENKIEITETSRGRAISLTNGELRRFENGVCRADEAVGAA